MHTPPGWTARTRTAMFGTPQSATRADPSRARLAVQALEDRNAPGNLMALADPMGLDGAGFDAPPAAELRRPDVAFAVPVSLDAETPQSFAATAPEAAPTSSAATLRAGESDTRPCALDAETRWGGVGNRADVKLPVGWGVTPGTPAAVDGPSEGNAPTATPNAASPIGPSAGPSEAMAASDMRPDAGASVAPSAVTYSSGSGSGGGGAVGSYLIGNYVWNDLNLNGIQELGEPGLPNIGVELHKASGELVDFVISGSDGSYAFHPGGTGGDRFYVQVQINNGGVGSGSGGAISDAGFQATRRNAAGSTDDNDSDIDANGKSDEFGMGEPRYDQQTVYWLNHSIDIGLYPPAAVGDLVWNDLNGNGVQDGEPGRAGVTVKLLGAGGGPATRLDGSVVGPAVTNSQGKYLFDRLIPGDYKVQVVNPDPAKFWFPDPDRAGDAIDSDGYADQAAQLTATTKEFALALGERKTDADQAVAVKIESVKWESTGTADGGVLGGQPGGTPGGGQRIFAEKKKYQDNVVADKVTVKVQLTERVANVTVNGYVYDVDDPSSNDPKLDLETREYDNSDGDFNVGLGKFSGVSDPQGVVTAIVQVSHAPGDNYRAVATTNGALDLPTVIKVKQDDGDRAGVYYVNGGAAPADGNDVTVRSGLLTVWRTLHLERDQMRKPDPAQPVGEKGVFGGNTDDPEPTVAIPHAPIGELATQLRAAYIDALDDLGATNAKPDFKFVHNIPTNAAQKDLAVGANGDGGSRDVRVSDPFWSVQILSCYEGPVGLDYDPTNTGDVLFGRTGFGVAIFTESIRDWCANTKEAHPAEGVFLQRVVLHEVLHALGIAHKTPGGDEGPLDPNINTDPNASQALTPTQIRLVRAGGPHAVDYSPTDAP